jgi:hypothetical protein
VLVCASGKNKGSIVDLRGIYRLPNLTVAWTYLGGRKKTKTPRFLVFSVEVEKIKTCFNATIWQIVKRQCMKPPLSLKINIAISFWQLFCFAQLGNFDEHDAIKKKKLFTGKVIE